jgi:two-component system OmpR family response regulator
MSEPLSAVAPEFIRFENLTLDVGGRALLDADSRDLVLTRSEFELLISFVRAPGRALSREYLLDAVGGRRGEPYDRSIDMLVASNCSPHLGERFRS